jgi:membrane protein insertase Oxa1/YidC/SpoIIIJ
MQDAEIAAFVASKTTGENALTQEQALSEYFKEEAQIAVKEAYETQVIHKTKFIWIKNIWVTDASYKNPVLDYESFKAEVSREEFEINGKEYDFQSVDAGFTNAYKADTYQIITGKLDTQKTEANGYYVLILLSIGTILLQQFISMRSQKEQQKYSTVDGQGATQQKTMMVTMTIMFAIFSFMYSSAFSIYLIVSNVFSMLSTVVINKVVDIVDTKKKNKGNAKVSDRYAVTMRNKNNKEDK